MNETQASWLVPPTRIERATRGLGTSPSSLSDNVSPQETTIQPTAQMGADGGDLSCPGSGEVATPRKDCDGT